MADAEADDKRLMDLLRLHSEEVRFQVNLTWDRAKSSLAFHAAWIAIVANMAGKADLQRIVPGMFLFAAASALLGGVMVWMGHRNYRAARDRRKQVEDRLGTQFGFLSTPGARGDSGPKWFRIYIVLVLLHGLLAGLALGGACQFWPRG